MNSQVSKVARVMGKGLRLSALPLLMSNLWSGCAAPGEAETDDGLTEAALVADTQSAATAVTEAPGLKVRVGQGLLQGKLVDQTRVFLGIPYAQPPVGALRFAAPVPAAAWEGTREAFEFGPVCPQPPGALSAPGVQSEDCLSLNVYAPRDTSGKRPVMVFIHGGAFVAGGSTQYDGERLSREGDLVVVTLNYRLGALGLLSLPQLDAKRPFGTPSGNDALRDQQLALKWVRDNIAAFGGDPSQVTLFGESAGSMSTCLHMVSPTSKNLADKYIMQSAACVGGMPINKKDQAQEIGSGLADEFCSGAEDVVACLRAQPASELVAWGAGAGISGAGWAPVINPLDPFLPVKPVTLIATGLYNKGSFIVGSNAREWGLFQLIGASPPITTVAALNAAIDAQFAEIAPLVKLHYRTTSDAAASATFVRMMTDAVFRCPARLLTRLTNLHGVRSYLYSYEHDAAYHAFELPYVFGNPNPRLGAPTLVEPLRAAMQGYWTRFANKGDPNGGGLPYWPSYNLLTDRHMTLKEAPASGSGLSRSDCDFWQTLYLLPT